MKRFKKWFHGISTTGKVIAVSTASLLAVGAIGASAQPNSPAPATPTQITTTQSKPSPKIEAKTVSATEIIPYSSTIVDDNFLDQGVTQKRTTGATGVRTITYEVTYTDDIETARKEISSETTTPAINEVIAKGTKAPQPVAQQQPSCPNGSYVNTYGNTVCNPYESNGAPAGASAQCEDGTYSFSQSRRGTCSGHGGVAVWL